jgi:uncharacterized membrane protein YfcA
MDLTTANLLLVTAAAAAVGLLAGIFGVGGGFLLIPVLNIGLGVPMHIAVGTTACQLLGPSTTVLLARRTRPADWRLPLIVAGGVFIGVLLGTDLLRRTTHAESQSGLTVDPADLLVLSVYSVLLTVLGTFSLWETARADRQRPIRRLRLAGRPIPPFARLPDDSPGPVSITVLAWFGLLVGFVAGLIGIGGGLLVLPGMIYLFDIPAQRAVTNATMIVWLVAAQSTVAHAWHGNVELPLVACLLLGGTVGARIGSDIGQRLKARQLRRSFGWLALATAAVVGGQLGRLLILG